MLSQNATVSKVASVFIITGVVIGILLGLRLWMPHLEKIRSAGEPYILFALLLSQFALGVIALLVYLGRKRYAIGAALGFSLLPLVYFPQFAIGVFVGGDVKRLQPLAVLFFAALFLVPGSIIEIVAEGHYARDFFKEVVFSFVVALVVVGLSFSVLAMSDEEKRSVSETFSDQALAMSLVQIHKCQQDFFAKHESFAPTLRDLGSAEPGCLSSELAAGSTAGFRIEYRPNRANGNRAVGYRIVATVNRFANNGLPVFKTDDSGIIFRTVEYTYDSTVGSETQSYQSVVPHELGGLLAVLKQSKEDTGAYPAQISELNDTGIPISQIPLFQHWTISKNLMVGSSYAISYEPELDSKTASVRRFTVQARPVIYGKTGIRSYFVDSSLRIHGTPQNRAATENDPIAPSCELGSPLRCESKLAQEMINRA